MLKLKIQSQMGYLTIHDEIGLKVQQFERKKEAGFQQAHPS